MTPETIRITSQLRQEFYSLFASALELPVKITNRNSHANNLSIASWVNKRQQLNYLCIFAHTAPDDLITEYRPLTLRLTLNKGGDLVALTRQKQSGQDLNQDWHFELVLLPEEILDFIPWIIDLIHSYETGSLASIPEPPYPLDSEQSTAWFHATRTQTASRQLSRQFIPQPEQRQTVALPF